MVTNIVQSVIVALLIATASFAWQTQTRLAEIRVELTLTRERTERIEANLHGLELWTRDYTVQHAR